MATSFQTIYKKFLSLIDDYELGLVSPEELNEVLYEYLDTAKVLFPQCKKDLEKYTVENGIGEFEETLDSNEVYILSLGMKKAWISPKLNSADLMTKDIGDRDYKAIQGTSYLKELSRLEKEYEEEVDKYARAYTWKNFTTEGW